MLEFRFRAVAKHSDRPMKVEVFLADGRHGYTPRREGAYLLFRSDLTQPVGWYAMVWGRRIAHGSNAGGTFKIMVDCTSREMPVVSGDPEPVGELLPV